MTSAANNKLDTNFPLPYVLEVMQLHFDKNYFFSHILIIIIAASDL